MRPLLFAIVFMPVFSLARLNGQAPASSATFTFETASVKPNQSRNCDRDGNIAGGRFVMTCATLHELIIIAYPRQDGRLRFEAEISGGPSWITVDHFDIVATAPEGQGVRVDAGHTGAAAAIPAELAGVSRIRMMAQALLADRFKLTLHNEPRDLAAYELRMDRNDGRPGPQLKKADTVCAPQRGGGAPCGGFKTIAPGHTVAHGVTMSLLAQVLQMPVSRNVVDRTGLQGTYDLELQYTPDRLQVRGPEGPATDANGVSVFTALREQLGLKLESTKAPVDVLVIDRAERPTPD